MVPESAVAPRTLRVLGVLWVVYGVLRLAMGIWLILFSATATVMFGTLLTRVANPFTLMDGFHIIYVLLVIWSLASGILGVLAGWWLLGGERSARTVSLVAAFFSLGHPPVGTTLGTYTLIVLLPWRGASDRRSIAAE